jgi:hypothetical protein
MAKDIQISRVTSANTTHLTKILAVNCKQLSSEIIDPLFLWYLHVGSVKAEPHQGREFIANGALENGAFCTVFSENFHKF